MKPLGNKILVKVVNDSKLTEGGLIDVSVKPLRTVEIVEVSEDSETKLKKGDKCLSEYGGVEIEKNLFLCNESLLSAVL